MNDNNCNMPDFKWMEIDRILRTGTDACREVFAESEWDTFEKLHKDIFSKLFAIIGKYIHAAASKSLGVSPNNLQLYFWPGYNSISDYKQRHVRIMRKSEFINIGELPCGITFPERVEYTSIPTNTCLWFNTLLSTDATERFNDGKLVTAGSTHEWLVNNRISLRCLAPTDGSKDDIYESNLNARDGIVENPLSILSVQVYEDISLPKEPAQALGIHTVVIGNDDKDSWKQWGPNIAKALNNTDIIKYQWEWPYPLPPADPIPATQQVLIEQRIRQAFYSIWLAAGFLDTDQWKSDCIDWIEKYAGVSLQGTRLSRRIENAIARDTSPERYKCWYSLVLEKPFSFDEATSEIDLGSAMLMTSQPIPAFTLLLIKRTVEWLYLSMRYCESERLIKQRRLSNIGHRLPGTLISIIQDLQEQGSQIPPQVHNLYLLSSLEQGLLPRWQIFEESSHDKAIHSDVIRQMWKTVVAPVGKARISISSEEIYRNNYFDLSEPTINVFGEQVECMSKQDIAAALSLICLLLLEAYQHAFMWSILEHANTTSSDAADAQAVVEVLFEPDAIAITNLAPRRTAATMRLRGGSQWEEIKKIERIIGSTWVVEYPINSDQIRHGDPWRVVIKRNKAR